MSRFDDALGRRQSQQQAKEGAAENAARSQRAAAEQAAAHLAEMIRDFCRALHGKVTPERVELPGNWVRRPLFPGSKRQYSPAGYTVFSDAKETGPAKNLTLITTDARLFQFPVHETKDKHGVVTVLGDFIEITAEAILQGRIRLADGGVAIKDGEPVVTNGWGEKTIEDSLAATADRLITGRRYP